MTSPDDDDFDEMVKRFPAVMYVLATQRPDLPEDVQRRLEELYLQEERYFQDLVADDQDREGATRTHSKDGDDYHDGSRSPQSDVGAASVATRLLGRRSRWFPRLAFVLPWIVRVAFPTARVAASYALPESDALSHVLLYVCAVAVALVLGIRSLLRSVRREDSLWTTVSILLFSLFIFYDAAAWWHLYAAPGTVRTDYSAYKALVLLDVVAYFAAAGCALALCRGNLRSALRMFMTYVGIVIPYFAILYFVLPAEAGLLKKMIEVWPAFGLLPDRAASLFLETILLYSASLLIGFGLFRGPSDARSRLGRAWQWILWRYSRNPAKAVPFFLAIAGAAYGLLGPWLLEWSWVQAFTVVPVLSFFLVPAKARA